MPHILLRSHSENVEFNIFINRPALVKSRICPEAGSAVPASGFDERLYLSRRPFTEIHCEFSRDGVDFYTVPSVENEIILITFAERTHAKSLLRFGTLRSDDQLIKKLNRR